MANGVSHYYGDTVRKLFLAGGLIMLLMLPFVHDRLPVSFVTSILIILAIDIFAGVTNPAWEWISIIDTAISLVGFLIFSYYAVTIYIQHGAWDILFWTNGILWLIFFFALYFATKTLRGKFTQ